MKKGFIAPIMVTILLLGYFSLYIIGLLSVPEILWLRVIGIILVVIFIAISISNLVHRIQEISSGNTMILTNTDHIRGKELMTLK